MNRLKLLDLAPELLCISSLDGKFIFTNPEFEKILGYSTEEILNINSFNIIHPQDVELVNSSLMSLGRDNKDTLNLKYRYMCKDGNYKWINWIVKVEREEQLIYAAGRDITLRKYSDFELIKTTQKLAKDYKTKSLFVENMNHEVRISVNNEPFSLKETLNSIYNNLLILGNSKGLEVSYYLDPLVDCSVIGDELKVRQILNNLISNAVKFTEEGYISFKIILISSDTDFQNIRFTVKDTGIGIEEGLKEKIFINIDQEDIIENKKSMDTRLGLSISKQLARFINGELEFESVAGKGSTFHFTCKIKKSSENYPCNEELNLNGENQEKVILCVEDNLINQEVMESIVNKKDYKYIAAYNGNEALEILKNNKVDLILMDVQMPELNGYETTKIIRAGESSEGHIPIIAMTAYAMLGDKDKCMQEGMDNYISKPFDIEELYKVLEFYLAN